MADDDNFFQNVFGDSDSEADFEGFDHSDVREVDENNLPMFEMFDLDHDEENTRDIELGWTRSETDKLLPPFTGEPGLKVDMGEDVLPIDFFYLFVPDNVFLSLAIETNRYQVQIAEKRGVLKQFARMKSWHETTADELKQFLGLSILTGLVDRPSLAEYWTTDPLLETPFFGKTMARDRFLNILSFLHILNNELALPRGDKAFDPIFKVRSVYDVLSENFRTVYIPNQCICIDEGMVPWKGRLSFRQYIPNKPDKFGMKLYLLCESDSGYICNADVYTGKDYVPDPDDENDDHGHSYNVVMGLLKKCNLLHKGYTVYTDNFYTSPSLFDDLLAEDTLAVGTVRTNRKEMPSAFKIKLKKGQEIYQQRGNLLAIKWTDKRDVCLLSTKHEPTITLTNKTDRSTGEPVCKPTVVLDYNRHMGGVDLLDQLNKYYAISRKSLKWWLKLFFHLMNMAITNAYILYKKKIQKPMSQYKFRVELARKLVSSYVARKPMRGRPSDHRENLARLSERHFPEKIPAKEGAKVKNPTRKCVVCNVNAGKRYRKGDDTGKFPRTETRYWCPDCEKPLCVDSCFRRYHTLVNYKVSNAPESSDSD